MAEAPYRVELVKAAGGGADIRLAGRLSFRESTALWRELHRLLRNPAPVVRFDVSAVEQIDGGAAALLVESKADAERRGARAEIVGASGRVAEMIELYDRFAGQRQAIRVVHIGILDQIGRFATAFVFEFRDAFAYIGNMIWAVGAAVRSPSTVQWRDVAYLMERAGADGLPIVLLINFLVGLVMGFQAAVQLKQVGANIFVADLVALSVTRELGPLMTAIIVAGRSGAAFAAELGTMSVSEEVDALRTLGFDPYRFLVIPRMVALVIVLPLLALVADLVGILGGMVVAMASLDLTVNAYLIETRKALVLWDIFSGVLKSAVFAMVIVLIACQRGLATRGGAEGVGRSTTSAVVTILFHLVAVDALFTVLFHLYGV